MINPDFKGSDVGWKRFPTRLLFKWALDQLLKIEVFYREDRESRERLIHRLVQSMLIARCEELRPGMACILWVTSGRMYRHLGAWQKISLDMLRILKFPSELKPKAKERRVLLPHASPPMREERKSEEEEEKEELMEATARTTTATRRREVQEDDNVTRKRPKTVVRLPWNLKMTETQLSYDPAVRLQGDQKDIPPKMHRYLDDKFTQLVLKSGTRYLQNELMFYGTIKTALYLMYEGAITFEKALSQEANFVRHLKYFRLVPGICLWQLAGTESDFKDTNWKNFKKRSHLSLVETCDHLLNGTHAPDKSSARISHPLSTRFMDRKEVAKLWEECHKADPDARWIRDNVDTSSFCDCYVSLDSEFISEVYREQIRTSIEQNSDFGFHTKVLANGLYNEKSFSVVLEKKQEYQVLRNNNRRAYNNSDQLLEKPEGIEAKRAYDSFIDSNQIDITRENGWCTQD